jgi:hypothetical protein
MLAPIPTGSGPCHRIALLEPLGLPRLETAPTIKRGWSSAPNSQGRDHTPCRGHRTLVSRIRCAVKQSARRHALIRRALGPDLVLAVRAGDHPDWTAVLDIEERGVADVPLAGVELVKHVGDLVALVILQGEPPAPLPLTRSGPGPSPRSGRLHSRPARRIPWPTRHTSAMMAGALRDLGRILDGVCEQAGFDLFRVRDDA